MNGTNWDAVAAVGEVVGAVAVVISLVYLAIQVRQNTRVMRAAAKQSLTEATQNFIYRMSEHPDCWVKLVAGEPAATPEEDARMSLLVRAMLRGFESQCYQAQAGLLEPEEWRAMRSAIRDICALPGVHHYWLVLKPHMSDRLAGVVESAADA